MAFSCKVYECIRIKFTHIQCICNFTVIIFNTIACSMDVELIDHEDQLFVQPNVIWVLYVTLDNSGLWW